MLRNQGHNGKRFLVHNCFPSTPIVNKLHTRTPRVKDFPSQYRGSKIKIIAHWLKLFQAYNYFPFTPSSSGIVVKLFACLARGPGLSKGLARDPSPVCTIDFKVKVTVHWLLKVVSGAYLFSFYTYYHETSYTDSPWFKESDVLYWFLGPKVKVTVQWWLKMISCSKLLSLCTYHREMLLVDSLLVIDVSYRFWF